MLPFALGLSAVLVLGTALWFGRDALSLRAWTGMGPTQADAVLVVVVGTAHHVRLVERAIPAEELVLRGHRGFALRERGTVPRRVVAADFEDVGALLGEAGWTEASLEIVAPPRREGGRAKTRRSRSNDAAGGGGDIDLAALSAQPTLSLAEAMAVLNSGAL